MSDSCEAAELYTNINSKVHQEILKSQQKVLDEVKNIWFFQYLVVEYYPNGGIKSIQKGLDWAGIISVGVIVVIAGVAIYYIGPPAVINCAKAMIQKLPLTTRLSLLL